MRPHRWIGWSAALAVACSGGAATGPTLAHVTEPAPQPVPVERADPDDVEGLARELGVAELRAGAVAYLRAHYDRALRVADSDHDAEGPTAVAAQVSEALVAAYVDEEDPELGLVILQLLVEMRAPDAWPALERALDWRRESTEEHAIIAAQAMEDGLADDARAEARATAAAEALTRIEGTRGVDNRMRIHLLRALGAIGHPASRRGLTTVAGIVSLLAITR